MNSHSPTLKNQELETAFQFTPRGGMESGIRRFSRACMDKMARLKDRLTSELTFRFGRSLETETIRQAINEADALAAQTAFPALFLPTLAEEKVTLASQWRARQRRLEERWLQAA